MCGVKTRSPPSKCVPIMPQAFPDEFVVIDANELFKLENNTERSDKLPPLEEEAEFFGITHSGVDPLGYIDNDCSEDGVKALISTGDVRS
jgi:hypothetical protein